MKLPWKLPGKDRMSDLLRQYRYVLIVAAAGLALLLWPAGDGPGEQSPGPAGGLTGAEEDFSVEALEEKLARALSQVEGAGEVSVILTVEQGMERVLASDRTAEQGRDTTSLEEQTVIISTGAGEEAVLITQRYPTFQGALVVCPGGDDPAVQLVLTRAMAALTGLGTDRITVCKGS